MNPPTIGGLILQCCSCVISYCTSKLSHYGIPNCNVVNFDSLIAPFLTILTFNSMICPDCPESVTRVQPASLWSGPTLGMLCCCVLLTGLHWFADSWYDCIVDLCQVADYGLYVGWWSSQPCFALPFLPNLKLRRIVSSQRKWCSVLCKTRCG